MTSAGAMMIDCWQQLPSRVGSLLLWILMTQRQQYMILSIVGIMLRTWLVLIMLVLLSVGCIDGLCERQVGAVDPGQYLFSQARCRLRD